MKDQTIFGIVGTALGVVGTATQVNEVVQIVSGVLTAIGCVITWIVIPLLNWHKKAKEDGKITTDELIEGAHTLSDGIAHVTDKDKKDGD